MEIDANVNFNISLGKLTGAIKEQTKWQRLATHAQFPVQYDASGTVIAPASGIAVIKLGGPDLGHIWQVRQIAVGGLSPNIVAAGTADVFISAADLRVFTNIVQLSMTDWQAHFAALPGIQSQAKGQMTCQLNEDIYVVISGGTSTQQYMAVANVEDYQEAAIQQIRGL